MRLELGLCQSLDCLPCAVWQFVLCLVMLDAFFTIAVMLAVFFGARTIRSGHSPCLRQHQYNSLANVSNGEEDDKTDSAKKRSDGISLRNAQQSQPPHIWSLLEIECRNDRGGLFASVHAETIEDRSCIGYRNNQYHDENRRTQPHALNSLRDRRNCYFINWLF